MYLPCNPAIYPISLSIYLREIKIYVHTKTYTQIFVAVLFIIALNWDQSRCFLASKLISNLWHIHTMDTQQLKKPNYWNTQLPRWVFRELLWMKKVSYKNLHMVLLHFTEHSWNDNIIKMGNISVVARD